MVAGFWQQTKNILRQLSAVVVVQGRLQSDLVFSTRTYLKRHFKAVPSGLRYYAAHTTKIPGHSRYVVIPFRLIEGSTIFYRKWEVVMFLGTKLITIRGLCNMDKLISDGIDDNESYIDKRNDQDTRFGIYPVIGREKTLSAGMGEAISRSRNTVDSSAPEVANSDSQVFLDLSVDKSYKYPMEYYQVDNKIDPFQSLYFHNEVMEHIEHAKKWRAMGDWYAARDIPWRRGWCLEGPGGTGKSSLARAMAEVMKIPIYDFKLNTLSDQEFIEQWNNMNPPCVALFEDFDNVFHGRESLTEHHSLSFDTILNVISGVNSFSGVFLILTTNHLENIDPAMGVFSDHGNGVSTRPGRIDTVIHLGPMDTQNKLRMANRVLKDWPELIDGVMAHDEAATPAQFQELCLQEAFKQIHKGTT